VSVLFLLKNLLKDGWFRGRVKCSRAIEIYSLYCIKNITSMECPHLDNVNMSVFVCGPKRYVVGTKCLCKFPT